MRSTPARAASTSISRAPGLGLIRVRDDGCGLAPEELPLALERHATSKIATLEDLEAIASFGFRGEALPSIASVARLRADLAARRSRAGLGTLGRGRQSLAAQAGCASGRYQLEVRDLFYNVPARRKFVRSPSTEFGHILRQVERLALGSQLRGGAAAAQWPRDPESALRPMSRKRSSSVSIACSGPNFAAARCASSAVPARSPLSGWLGLPTAARAQPDRQFWFVNGSAVRDRLLGNAVRLGFRDVLYQGRHPSYVLHLTLDPRQIDVNAHPAKLELRFRDSRARA